MSVPSALGDRIEQLNQAARDGDVGAIMQVVRKDANILDAIDAIPSVDTPLHESALAGGGKHIRVAKVMMWLRPSFSRKPNPDGYIPVHLALQVGHTLMVHQLLQSDADLVRVKGREGRTALHFVAEKSEQYDVLVKFLSDCPNSIEDVTIQNQTALHIALESNNMKAFEHLVSCLEKFGSEKAWEILNQLDENGWSVLRVALFKKNREAAQLLRDLRTKLEWLGVGEASCLYRRRSLFFEHIILGSGERSLKRLGLSLRIFFVRLRRLGQTVREWSVVSNDDRDVLLVVAALLIPISHQAATNLGSNPSAAAPAAGVEFFAGTAIGQSIFSNFEFIATINYIIFTLSIIMTFLLLPGGFLSALFKMALVQLWVSCNYSLTVIIQSMWVGVFLLCLTIAGLCLLVVVVLLFGAGVKMLDWIFYVGYICIIFVISFAFFRSFY